MRIDAQHNAPPRGYFWEWLNGIWGRKSDRNHVIVTRV